MDLQTPQETEDFEEDSELTELTNFDATTNEEIVNIPTTSSNDVRLFIYVLFLFFEEGEGEKEPSQADLLEDSKPSFCLFCG